MSLKRATRSDLDAPISSLQFSVSELPEIGNVDGDPREYRDRLGKFVTDQRILLEYSQDIAPARGTSAGGRITLLPDETPAEEFATLAHEVAHELMHRDERRASTSRRSRETEAEAVAFVVCKAIGLPAILAIACTASARLAWHYLLFNRTFSSHIKTTTSLESAPS